MKRIISLITVILMLVSMCVFSTGTVFATEGDYTYKTVTGGVEITGYTGKVADGANMEIPATLGGMSVVGIGEKAFYQNKSKANVIISSGVEYISNRAFAGSFITGVVIPDTITELGNSAFSTCVYLTDVTLSKGTKAISNSCFYSCTRLESLVIPEGVEVIEDMAFQSSNHLSEVTLPSTLKSIGEYSFAYTGLTELTIPEGTEEIKNSAFFICDKLTSVEVPGSVKSIGQFAFANCYALSSLTLGEGIEVIKTSAFDSCALTEVKIPSTVTQIGEFAFGYVFNESAFDYEYAEDFRILCTEGSAGFIYAAGNSIPYEFYTVTPPTSAPTEPAKYMKGDANMDMDVNIKDATAIQKHIAVLEILSDEALILADYDEDTEVNIKDATAIQKFIAGIAG